MRQSISRQVIVKSLDARHAAGFVREKFDRLGVEVHGNAALLHGLEQIADQAGAARDALTVDVVHAVEQRPGFAADLGELDAYFALEPLEVLADVFDVRVDEFRIGAVLRHLHHVVAKSLTRLVVPFGLLLGRAPGGHAARSVKRVARGVVHFFQYDWFESQIVGFDGGHKAGRARADDDGVVGTGAPGGCAGFARGGGRAGRGACQGRETALESASSADHVRAPFGGFRVRKKILFTERIFCPNPA